MSMYQGPSESRTRRAPCRIGGAAPLVRDGASRRIAVRVYARVPGLIERVEHFFGLGGRPRIDPRSFEGWR
jgi:hypothetical protein